MDHNFGDVQASEIVFTKSLFHNEHSEVFLVQIRGITCVMKVHRDKGPPQFPVERQTGIHNCEVRAYRRLMQNGLGHQGIVPRYYREIQHLDVKDYQPHLRRFLDEERPPSAIFLEYIPNMMTILPERYTKGRIESMIHGIQQIHKALVLHFDSYPRNIMVFENDPGRVIWIDFDRAQTYDADTITERNRRWIQEEEEDVHVFGESMKEDHALGKMWNTLPTTRDEI